MALVAVAGGSYMNKRIAGRGEFWTLFLFVTLAMSLAASANNLLLIFLAIEFLSITSYLLVGFVRDDLRSSEAGIKYFLFGSIASSIMLYGMKIIGRNEPVKLVGKLKFSILSEYNKVPSSLFNTNII